MLPKYDKTEPETIQKMFGAIAQRYDHTNAVLSLGLHRYWNKALVKKVAPAKEGSVWLDLCCGTGDIAYTYLKDQKAAKKALLVDFCEEMLFFAKEKAKRLELKFHDLTFLKADVQQLPLAPQSVSVATMAYGIRNVKDPRACFREVARVLEKGGTFGILELTRPSNRMVCWGHQLYLKNVLPLLGKWLTDNQEAYRYLCTSIQNFISMKELREMLQEAGFKKIEIFPLTLGTATLLIGHT